MPIASARHGIRRRTRAHGGVQRIRGRVAVHVHVSYPAFVRVDVYMFALADQAAQDVYPKRDQHSSDQEFKGCRNAVRDR
jgi:hypothetical protein